MTFIGDGTVYNVINHQQVGNRSTTTANLPTSQNSVIHVTYVNIDKCAIRT